MCESYNVLQSSSGSASDMSHTLNDYGGGMGAGIRKLTDEFFNVGKKIGYQKGYDAGFRDGFCTGHFSGIIKGSIVTTIVLSTVGATAWGVKKVVDYCSGKKQINFIPSQGKNHKTNCSGMVAQSFSEETLIEDEEHLQ